jgi:hypothetical protein
VVDRPYTRYSIQKESGDNNSKVNIVYQKPTRASSEMEGKTANRANDKDTTTFWQANMNDPAKWWLVDMENLYTVTEVSILFTSEETGLYKIELSKDNQNWETIAGQKEGTSNERYHKQLTNSKIIGRFLRIAFTGPENKPVAISEVEVSGKPVY